MSYTQRIYIQNENGCVRNHDILNIRMTSDWCEFTPPTVDISGATKIQSVSGTSEGVYLITGQTEIPLVISFTGGSESYTGNTIGFIEVYRYNPTISGFTNPYIYQTSFSFSGDVVGSAYTTNLPISAVSPDNEYLIKPYFNFESCTEFLNALGVRYSNRNLYGTEYLLYNDGFDYYISVSYPAGIPILTISTGPVGSTFGGLVVYTQFPTVEKQTNFTLQNTIGEVMVNLNGVTLAPNYDFTVSGGIVTISAGTELTDVVTFVHSIGGEDLTGLNNDLIIVPVIVSGVTNGQGTNNVYYNTTEGKYEVYSSVDIASSSDVVVTLNGVTLANNIDYYKSTSNDRRIILEGVILTNDVINLYYFGNASYVGQIYTNTPEIGWYIEHLPTLVNGQFTLELSTGDTFTNISYSSVTDYEVGVGIYSDNLIISGDVGTQYYYRVKNEKFYQPITGNTIDTIAYSETVPIIIQSNSINSY